MNLWQRFEKENCIYVSQGISFHYEKGIDKEIRKLFIDFSNWLRHKYVFPIHLNVYIINKEQIKLLNGSLAYGSFRWFKTRSPRIKVPSKIEMDLLRDYSIEEIYEQILSSLVHEITHYYQWVLKLDQSNAVSERQANYYRYRIIDKYKSYH